MSENKANRVHITMAALNRYIESHIVDNSENKHTSLECMMWGKGNDYPEYLYELYKNATTLRSCIDGTADFIAGDDVIVKKAFYEGEKMNKRGDTAFQVVSNAARDLAMYGGFALQIINNALGEVNEVYNVDFKNLRTNEDNSVFYYCENWKERYRRNKVVEYAAWMPGTTEASTILYWKNEDLQTYPLPIYSSAIKSCEMERCIDDFHLNGLVNGFSASYLVNFNNGIPTDQVKDEVERMFNDKFSGSANAGRIVFSWNDNKDAAATIEKMELQDFGERYATLAKWSRQQIFTAFRANPNLFGIPTENLGFSNEEYEAAFKLFNRTRVRPFQRAIIDTFDKLYGEKGSLEIRPFSLDGADTNIQ